MRRVAIAVVLAAALVAPAAAHAALPPNPYDKPILLVSGPEAPNCAAFDALEQHLREYETVRGERSITFAGGTITTIGPGCEEDLSGSTMEDLGDELAQWVKAKGKTYDVVAWGSGGLIVRYALMRERLKLEDVVTLGTPHEGSAALATACAISEACDELAPGSAFLTQLAERAQRPQGPTGTDWSLIGSAGDHLVPLTSAMGMDVAHKARFLEKSAMSHDDLLTDDGLPNATIEHENNDDQWTYWTKSPHVLDRVAQDLVFGDAGDAPPPCGLQSTQPELCGQTPVVMIPGFGGSQLECTNVFGVADNVWPDALDPINLDFGHMTLDRDGITNAEESSCGRSVHANGLVVDTALGKPIHRDSWAWLQRVAPGRAFQFGWDFRKGPDQTLDRLDHFIDDLRNKFGVNKVAIVSHSYGGVLTRWYIDDLTRARKVTRVANFGSPWWGAPKGWFGMAYGYETPEFSMMDLPINDAAFKGFTKNLMGLYYLFPNDTWFQRAPEPLRSWLEVNELPTVNTTQVADDARMFGGNPALIRIAARNHRLHIDGFTKRGGVDFRTFVGSGRATLGHVRAWSGTEDKQYSWINGDGTVPLISARQYARDPAQQMGARIPTYNFCDIGHMAEMEDARLQAATTPFIVSGDDPLTGGILHSLPCNLSESQFTVTGDEDAKSLQISRLAEGSANASRVRARASQAPMTLSEAIRDELVQRVHEPGRVVFVANEPIAVHSGPGTSVQVEPITGEGKTGAPKRYDAGPAGVDVSVNGSRVAGASVSVRAADTRPPRTTARLRHGRLVLKARDASRVVSTMVRVGGGKPRRYVKPMRVRGKVRYWSVDEWGNVESVRVVAARRGGRA